ncbi:MAG TPA: hypothetical protein ENN22_14245 [bacterium]|nr:hypothetical protein [bacterium]
MKKLLLLLLAVILLASCGKKDDDPNQEFAKKGALDLMTEIEKDEYTPPADNNMTADQVEMYLKVKQQEISYAQQAAENLKQKAEKLDEKQKPGKKPGLNDYMTALKAAGDVADFVTADLRAAKKLGYNAKEYQWIRDTIIKNQLALWADTTRQVTISNYSGMIDQLEEQLQSATSEEEKSMVQTQIASMKKVMSDFGVEPTPEVGVTEHNKNLILKYNTLIKGLEAEFKKWQLLDSESDHLE